eukprot:scaffold10429_cov126-Cylindrotheca_fusiformis.AAC.5
MDFDDMQYSFGSSSSSFRTTHETDPVPHQGSLCRVEGNDEAQFVLEILLEDNSTHELFFQRNVFEFALRLFAIMDTDSRGKISKAAVKEFVTIRCPVFWRRDDNLRSIGKPGTSPTFEELWRTVVTCSVDPRIRDSDDIANIKLGVEGWVVFCRFIALAQYLEAKRRFSGRHLQQTMRHRNAPRGSEVVVVDVPPPAPPIPLSANQLAQYERESHKSLPLPELDLDHSLIAAHDVLRRRQGVNSSLGRVKLELFGPSTAFLSSQSSQNGIEFCLTYVKGGMSDSVSVRRSMKDMKWLNETLTSHKVLGGTLCGRILPPFPNGNRLSCKLNGGDSSIGSTGDALAAAATAGVGMIKDSFKSLWSSYSSTTPKASTQSGVKKVAKSIPESYYNPNSPDSIARQLERYINYLLDHPALSTSFPLNTILKASQSGLEAAKQSLEEHSRESNEINEQAPKLDDGKLSTFWLSQGSGSQQLNLSWVRTAAQAAVAIQLHGVLETSGLQSASARLQHASLPSFGHSRTSAWNDDDGEIQVRQDSESSGNNEEEESFEEGVLHVNDELEASDLLDESVGYDLLPLPVPTPERTILAASNGKNSKKDYAKKNEARFRYGNPSEDQLQAEDHAQGQPVYLGEMAVDENIDKLRDVIGSVDNTLNRCLASSGGIGRSRRERLAVQLDVVRGLDSWEGLRGKFVSQRALLKGLSGIEQSREVFEESDLMLIDALATSAVSAAEDVRSTVRAARTAGNAKTAASSAAVTAQKACENGKFSSIDEARAAQTRASIAQSHAIHAAVVEYEANTAKRRAALALAHDVKCWNAHRKREVLQTCLAYAKSQHEATRRAVDAWSCLGDGYVGSELFPAAQSRRVPPKQKPVFVEEEPQATIYGNLEDSEEGQVIIAVEHELLKHDNISPRSSSSSTTAEPETILPLVVASPIPEEGEDEDVTRESEDFGASSNSPSLLAGNASQTASQRSVSTSAHSSLSPSTNLQSHSFSASSLHSKSKDEAEVLTSSMQSLVDGLMSWGGQIEEEDFALPTGMAASIALEESGVFGPHSHS